MKFKILTTLMGLLLSSQAFADYIQLGITKNGAYAVVVMKSDQVFARKLVDVIVKSPEVKEVTNMYEIPGTRYEGKGFTLQKPQKESDSGVVSLRIVLGTETESAVTSGGNFLALTSDAGVTRYLHTALMKSQSAYALTKSRPGTSKISLQEGQVVVLEEETYVGSSLACTFMYNDNTTSRCALHLK